MIAQPPLSGKKVNYLPTHYDAHLQKTVPYLSSKDVNAKAKSNLQKIGVCHYIALQTNYQRLQDHLVYLKLKQCMLHLDETIELANILNLSHIE